MIRIVLVFIILLMALAFFLQNQEEVVTLHYLFGLHTASTPIYKPILMAFGVGLLVATILLFPAWVRDRMELRRKRKALQDADADLARLREQLDRTGSQVASRHPQAPGEEPPDD